MKRHLIGCIALVYLGTAGAQSLGERMRTVGIDQPLPCLTADAWLENTDPLQPQTIDFWKCTLVGQLTRSATIRFLGRPSRAVGGMLFYDKRVKDADTDELYTLQVIFLKDEKQPATHVYYFSFDPSATLGPH